MRMNQGGPEVEDDEKGRFEFDDEVNIKLFVGGLSWETTQDSLQRYFSRYGEVIDCVVMKNNETGRSRGFGFVTFADPTNVQIVLSNGPHNLDGRTIDTKQCNPRTLQKPKIRGGCYPKVFLGGLPSNVTETDLRMHFGRYGKVMEVVIMYDQEKKKSRGFGFLSFEDEASVERVTNEHYINLNGKQVEIKKAEPRDGSANHKMPGQEQGQSANWGPPGPTPIGMMQGPNGQMNAGPPMNMAAAMAAPNAMMQGYQGWGTSPQQQSYGYGTPNPNSYQGWGAPPPQPQGPPPHQWGGYNATAQQSQGYGSYDMYNSTTGGPNPTSGGGGNWNTWGLQTNSGSASNDLYNRAPSGPGGASSGGPPAMPSGPNTTNSKIPSDYSAYSAGYGNYTNDQSSSYPRSYTNDIISQPYPPQQQDDFLKPY